MKDLQKTIGYSFKNKKLLENALTHKSYINESGKKFSDCNERLEFLGDSVLGACVAEYLFLKYPEKKEGEMSKIRAMAVCEEALAQMAVKWNLGEYLIMSHGEETSGGRTKNSILSDAVEAVIAAVYLDGGAETAKSLIHRFFIPSIETILTETITDFKTQLQELCQKYGKTVTYKILGESGPDHEKKYIACAEIDGVCYEKCDGISKKKAEQHAAEAAYKALCGKNYEV